jgi:nucleobase:cation symporter-1, NCS1 family
MDTNNFTSTSIYAPAQPVPDAQRLFTERDAFALWFSLGMGLLGAQIGALLGAGMSLPHALVAIALGGLLGAVLLALAGVIGADTGLAAMSSLRITLGEHGALIPTLINVVQLIGWGSFEVVIMRDSFDALSQQYLGFSCPLAWALLAGLTATLVAVLGPLSFVRRFLRSWGVWLLLLAAVWLSYDLLAHRDLRALWQQASTGTMSFGTAIDLLVANAMSWLPLISDYTRFGRRPKHMFRGTLCGYGIASLWFYALGAAYALASGDGALLVSTLASASSGLALFLILLGETDNAFADIHSAAVSTGMLAKGCSVRILSLVFGLLCIGIALSTPMARYENFLLLIGSVFAPLFGVVLTDHFILRRRRALSAVRAPKRWGSSAFLAWIIGIATYHLIHARLPYVGATLPSLAFSGLCYWVLARQGRTSIAANGATENAIQ